MGGEEEGGGSTWYTVQYTCPFVSLEGEELTSILISCCYIIL